METIDFRLRVFRFSGIGTGSRPKSGSLRRKKPDKNTCKVYREENISSRLGAG
jgi:hypothetical protein